MLLIFGFGYTSPKKAYQAQNRFGMLSCVIMPCNSILYVI